MAVAIRMPLPKRFTLSEYLVIERKAETKSEFHQGQIFAMAGGMPDHSLIAGNIVVELGQRLKGGSCRVYNSDLRTAVANGEAVYYADVAVVCGEPKLHGHHRDVISNPILVVEVLSRSTARYDRLVKVPLYQRTPSIQDILLVSQDRARVDQISRTASGWKTVAHSGLAATIEIPVLGCTLPLSAVYANIMI